MRREKTGRSLDLLAEPGSPATTYTPKGCPVKGPFAVHGLTYALRIILNDRPKQAATHLGWLLRCLLRRAWLGQFCVVSGGSPIWLSAHGLQPVREDGKFKNLANTMPPLWFPIGGNNYQQRWRNQMHNVYELSDTPAGWLRGWLSRQSGLQV